MNKNYVEYEYKLFEKYEICGIKVLDTEPLATICRNDELFVERCVENELIGEYFVKKYLVLEDGLQFVSHFDIIADGNMAKIV